MNPFPLSAFITFFLILGLSNAGASEDGRPLASRPPPISKQIYAVDLLRDPLYPGNALNWTLGGQRTKNNRNLTTQLQYSHTFDPTFLMGVTFPFFLADPDNSSVTRVPRVGGGPYGRIYTNFLNRVMGDARNYLDFDVQIGLPYQSDPTLKNSAAHSWLYGGEVTGHFRLSRLLAVEASFSDAIAFPSETQLPKIKQYKDSSNQTSFSTQILYYVTRRWDIRGSYQEFPPYEMRTGTDTASASFIAKSAPSLRQRLLGLGFDLALSPENWLLSLDGNFRAKGNDKNTNGMHWSGRLKWVF